MIAIIPTEGDQKFGVCLDGKWAGWLMHQHADGHWVTDKKLDTVDPYENSPFAAMFRGPIKESTDVH